jgi:hypothetical protein
MSQKPEMEYTLLQLDLNTGDITEVPGPGTVVSLHTYFKAINVLNRGAHKYGLVYLADDKALALLKERGI